MIVLALLLATSTTLGTPPVVQADTAGVRQELQTDITVLERKVIGLAQAMAEEQYDWTPMKGVRTVRQVYLHVAINNYVFPSMTGTPPPAGVQVSSQGVSAYENADTPKAEVVRRLQESFAHLKAALAKAGDLDRTVDFFGSPATARQVWLDALFHIHEHLGQAIAYARSNSVVPPWSR